MGFEHGRSVYRAGLLADNYGGWAGRNTPFQPEDPEALPAIRDLQTLRVLFTHRENGFSREWWKLVPHDELVSSQPNPADGSPGRSYCLADPGQCYIVYAENTKSTELVLQGTVGAATYRLIRFDPAPDGERCSTHPARVGRPSNSCYPIPRTGFLKPNEIE